MVNLKHREHLNSGHYKIFMTKETKITSLEQLIKLLVNGVNFEGRIEDSILGDYNYLILDLPSPSQYYNVSEITLLDRELERVSAIQGPVLLEGTDCYGKSREGYLLRLGSPYFAGIYPIRPSEATLDKTDLPSEKRKTLIIPLRGSGSISLSLRNRRHTLWTL